MRAQLSRFSFMIEKFGLERMREPHVKYRFPLLMRLRDRAVLQVRRLRLVRR
jgi:hypothetical protein